MNILYVGNFVFPDKSPGALKVLSFAKIMRSLHHTVSFASTQKDDDSKKVELNSHEGFSIYSEKQLANKLYFIRKIYTITLFEKLINMNSFNLVIAYNPQSLASLRMASICKKKNIRYVCDIDEWDEPFPSYNVVMRACVKFNIWLNMTVANKKADGLILVSSYLKEYYKNKLSIVVPPLVDLSDPKWTIANRKKATTKNFVYFGSGGRIKEDLKSVVESFLKIPQAILNVVGITKDEYEKDYSVVSQNYSNVIFWGRVEHQKALRIVQECDASIILRTPTRKNNAGFPTKFVESISLGTPVLCNRFSDVDIYISAGKNGAIVKKDSLVDELIMFKCDEIEVNRMLFDYNSWLSAFNDFFNEILKRGHYESFTN